MSRHFKAENKQTARKQGKICARSFIKEMHIKTSMTDPFLPTKTAKIKKSIPRTNRDVEQLELRHCWCEMCDHRISCFEKQFLTKLKIHRTHDLSILLLGKYSRKQTIFIHKEMSTGMSIATLLTMIIIIKKKTETTQISTTR